MVCVAVCFIATPWQILGLNLYLKMALRASLSKILTGFDFKIMGLITVPASVMINSIGLKELIATFGEEILNPDKSLNRKKLRRIVFNNSEKLAKINAILHPKINSSIENKIKHSKDNLVIVVIPLLCTSHNYKWLDRIVVVDVKVETQMQRLLARDNINRELAGKMINSQCSRKERLKLADDVISNEQSLNSLKQRVKVLHSLYKSMEN